jgi:hypothetical protein
MNMEKTQIVEALHQGVCEVVFTKTDGTERTMKCTLQNLPNQGKQVLSENPADRSVIPVWDTESLSWKSFSVESVKSFRRVGSLLNG